MTGTLIDTRDTVYVAGRWIPATSGRWIDIVSPSTEQLVYRVQEAGRAEIDAAVTAARRVADSGTWASVPPAERAKALLRFADAVEARGAEIATAVTNEMGAPVNRPSEVDGAVGLTRYLASVAAGLPFEEHVPGVFRPSIVRRVPVGVVAAVVPWNAPLFLALQKVVPALLAGCPVLVKPAPETAYDSFVLADAFDAAGLAEGVVSVLPADREGSEYLVAHPGVDKISFTGSTATGQRVAGIAARDVKRVTLELGGKSAAVVLPDADLAAAMPALVTGTTINSGQACSLLSRVLVPRARHEEFMAGYTEALDAVVVGDPFDPATTMGPLVSRRQYERVLSYVRLGAEEGATAAYGGTRPDGPARGYYLRPTVFTGVDNGMRIAQEEIFGPVICVIAYDTVDEAVRIANDTPFGLSGAVFGPQEEAVAVASRVRAGSQTVNSAIDFDFAAPYGGFKSSGTGRELGGAEGILGFTEALTIGV
ncbi:aldehyde dehydrogenase [Actinacidiphila acididurans]|uniref:Aldehyde dehydrogenase n=1 Tax=Actinacidiphila acididurans TaxID=2784346 RepID=A0ABS2TM52_9ACTN|nr:aldehyde dehydrogenase [Actinacidiphila acididurans]MBM9504419.1 aldehyde dehydrogenase [Actinacidiphila acididurans]